MPLSCSCGRQVLYGAVYDGSPAGKKSEFSPSQGPTVALVKTPLLLVAERGFSEKALLSVPQGAEKPVSRRWRKDQGLTAAILLAVMKSASTAMIWVSVG